MQDEQQQYVAKAPDTVETVYRTNFTDTAAINLVAGNPDNAGWEAIDKQIDLIESEFEELRDLGVKGRNIHELRDGICDVLFTVYGLAHRAGLDADLDYAEVVRSNLTKFDDNEDDVVRTRAKYMGIDVETVAFKIVTEADGKVYYVTKSAKDQVGSDGKKYPKGKWLKSFRFEEPSYAPLPEHVAAKLEGAAPLQDAATPAFVDAVAEAPAA